MHLGFDEDQELLRKTIRDFMDKECPRSVWREVEEERLGYARGVYAKLAEMGVVGLLIPEEHDGSGGDFVDVAILYEEMGRALCVTPHLGSVVIAGQLLVRLGSDEQKREWLPNLAMGETVMAVASEEYDAEYNSPPGVTIARKQGDRWILNGVKPFVQFAEMSDRILVSAATEEAGRSGTTLFLVPPTTAGVRITATEVISGDSVAEVEFSNVLLSAEMQVGPTHGARPVLSEVLDQAKVALSAMMVGGAQGALNLAVQYSKERVQFDRPIGSFQALQMKMADVAAGVEGARWLTYEAAWRIARGKPYRLEAARAKAFTSEAYQRATVDGIQLMGGYGVSEEYDMQLYYRRAVLNKVMFGSPDHNREMVAQHNLG